jgi:hypothetical protein
MEPVQFEESNRRDLFREIYYLTSISNDEELKCRLLSRPSSRRSSGIEFITQMQEWNRSLKERAKSDSDVKPQGVFDTLETKGKSLDESASELIEWLTQRLE